MRLNMRLRRFCFGKVDLSIRAKSTLSDKKCIVDFLGEFPRIKLELPVFLCNLSRWRFYQHFYVLHRIIAQLLIRPYSVLPCAMQTIFLTNLFRLFDGFIRRPAFTKGENAAFNFLSPWWCPMGTSKCSTSLCWQNYLNRSDSREDPASVFVLFGTTEGILWLFENSKP